MKKIACIFSLLLFIAFGANAETTGDTSHVKTALRIILPENKAGWDYFFQVDGMGTPPLQLTGIENSVTIDNGKKAWKKAYIYAVSTDKTKQTNKYSIKAAGRPIFLLVKGTNGVYVQAKKLRITKYTVLRQAIPEDKRMPWIN
jgi:hypothetical protein